MYEKYAWKVGNFGRLKTNKVVSVPFVLGGYKWTILLFPRGNKVENFLSIYLEPYRTDHESKGWSRDVKFKLFVFNQFDAKMTITKEITHRFVEGLDEGWGFTEFMTLAELCDREKGFLVKDALIVGVEIFVSNSIDEKPSKKADAELVSAALGRVIYFLKTRKVKDMNEQACNELQGLWDELKKFKFDITWLEPQVQSALGMKSYVEKALEVEKLKENMIDLELETERLEGKLAAAEKNLEIESELLKAEGIKEKDLNSELDSGSWIMVSKKEI